MGPAFPAGAVLRIAVICPNKVLGVTVTHSNPAAAVGTVGVYLVGGNNSLGGSVNALGKNVQDVATLVDSFIPRDLINF